MPIREVDEIEYMEVLMVPEENMEPIPVREQPPPYIPVCGQCAVCGHGQAQPFCQHVFPYTVHQDQQPAITIVIRPFDGPKH